MRYKSSYIKIFNLILFCIWFSSALTAQDISYARSVIDTLTSPEMAGRGYVEDGDLKAASYIAEEFKIHGVTGFQNSFLQNFSLSINTFPENISLVIDGKKMMPGVDYQIDPCSPPLEGNYKTFKYKKSWLSNDKAFEKAIEKNKKNVLLLDETILKLPPNDVRKVYDQLKHSTLDISGILTLTDRPLIWSASQFVCPIPGIIVKKSRIKSANQLSVNIESKFKNRYRTQNVIGYIPGQKYSDSLLVFTAHYDHLGKMGKDTYYPGANDNASGIAMLLSLVKHYSQNPPDFTVVFIAFGAEESGLLGSRHFVEHPYFSLQKIKFLINLDMVGTGDEGITVVNGSIFEAQFHTLVSINNEHKLLPTIYARGESCNSDHCPFYRKGVPTFFIYAMGGHKAYHDLNDRAETLTLTGFEGTFKLLLLFTSAIMDERSL